MVILASSSPRRVELLAQMGLVCEIFPADIDETHVVGETPEAYVIRLAQQKADTCLKRLPKTKQALPILAADTTVVSAGNILGKPENIAEAKTMLQTLSGTTHEVHTAVALAFNNQIEVVLSSTLVEMMPLTLAQIDAYIASGEHQGKAGSYGIQGLAGTWIKRIDGSYSGVMGLPIYETAMLLRKHALMTI
jgi:septum formation protein